MTASYFTIIVIVLLIGELAKGGGKVVSVWIPINIEVMNVRFLFSTDPFVKMRLDIRLRLRD